MNFWGFTAAVFVSRSEMPQLDGNPASITNLQSEFISPDFPPASFFLRRSSVNTDRGVLAS